MIPPVSGRRLTSRGLAEIVTSLNERVDAAALDPDGWQQVVEDIQGLLPGLRVGFEAIDLSIEQPLAIAVAGWDQRTTMDYLTHYAAISPWLAAWPSLKALQPYLSDEQVPLAELKKTEFYTDWLRHVGEAEVGSGIKILDSEGRSATLHVHYGLRHMAEHHAILAAVFGRIGTRMRGALMANRALALATPARRTERARGTLMDTLLDPAFLVDERCRLVAANAPGEALIREEALVAVGARDAFRLVAEADQRSFARAVEQVCRAGPSLTAGDLHVSGGGRAYILSLLPVAKSAAYIAARAPLALFTPRALALCVLRPAGEAPPQERALATLPANLTPAELRFLEALLTGGSLAEVAERVGIAYETARSRLKTIYAKTGVHSQRELMSLLLRGK